MKKQRILRLLLVEDEPGDMRLMQLALQKNNFSVELHSVTDGLKALQFLRREGGSFNAAPRPDLVLLDLKMPGQSGLEFLEAMKKDVSLRAIPVVVITTSALNADVSEAYRLGAAGYVLKQTDMNEFVAAIQKIGQYWLHLVLLPENP